MGSSQIISMANIFIGHCKKTFLSEKTTSVLCITNNDMFEKQYQGLPFLTSSPKVLNGASKRFCWLWCHLHKCNHQNFSKMQKSVLKPIKDLQFSSICKTRKTANQPATLLIFNFLQSSHAIPAGNKRNCFYQKKLTSFQQAG